jgi:hypothetical protein
MPDSRPAMLAAMKSTAATLEQTIIDEDARDFLFALRDEVIARRGTLFAAPRAESQSSQCRDVARCCRFSTSICKRNVDTYSGFDCEIRSESSRRRLRSRIPLGNCSGNPLAASGFVVVVQKGQPPPHIVGIAWCSAQEGKALA